MDQYGRLHGGNVQFECAVRKGPWRLDIVLMSYIAVNGEERMEQPRPRRLRRGAHAGLNRTGKSCRLRWLNYLRPGVRCASFTPEEQAH